jgi:hypothetical protein
MVRGTKVVVLKYSTKLNKFTADFVILKYKQHNQLPQPRQINQEVTVMKSKILIVLMLFLIAFMPGALPSAQATPPSITGQIDQAVPSNTTGQTDQPSQTSLMETYARLPLLFIHNQGQVDSQVAYYVKTPGQTIYLTPSGMVFDLIRYHNTETADLADMKAERLAFSLDFVGGSTSPLIQGVTQDKAVVNYFIGNDPDNWHTDIPTYREVLYQDVYPGIDLRLYGKAGSLEYEFIVQPGADVSDIALAYSGVDGLNLESNELVVSTAFGDIKQSQPYIYQQIGDDTVVIAGGFSLLGADSYGFEVGNYDAVYPLIIDPSLLLAYSTYLGGDNEDRGNGIAVDSSGCAYITGETLSTNFPTENEYQTNPDTFFDAFVSKLDTTESGTSSLIYSTYLGGTNSDYGHGIAVESDCAYVTGFTWSTDFPTWHQYMTEPGDGYADAFVTRFNATGDNITYSTYLGGSVYDYGNGIAVKSEHAYVTGQTDSNDFPTKTNRYDNYQGGIDAFVAELDTTLSGDSSFIYSTYLGGSGDDYGNGIAVDSSGYAYVTGDTNSTDFTDATPSYQTHQGGYDAFVAKLDTGESGEGSLVYATYLGGSNDDYSWSIAVDSSGCAYIAGETYSTNFPTVNYYHQDYGDSNYDAFVTKFNTAGTGLDYSTYLGGDYGDYGRGIAVASPYAYVTGYTDSTNFPIFKQYQTKQPSTDVFVTKLDTSLSGSSSLIYSTYLGGNGTDWGYGIAVDSAGCAYLTGATNSTDFPTENQYQGDQPGWDAFVAKFGSAFAADVSTDDASNVEETTATLNGTLDDDAGEACDVRFNYGTTTGYGSNTGWESGKVTDDTFLANISSLSPGTLYHFRAEADNSAGTVHGSDKTFTTKPYLPTGFTATAMSAYQIDLAWTKGDGATKTMIRRSTGDYPSTPSAGDFVYYDTGESWSDTGLTPNTTYYYGAWSWVNGSDIWSTDSAQATEATPDVSTVTGVIPSSGGRDDTFDAIITGTNFIGVSAVSFGDGIAVNSAITDDTTQITANITIALDAALGTRDVSVTTSGGIATLPAGFTVTGGSLPGVVGDYSTKSSIKFYDWRCNKWIVVKGGTLHITDQDKHKIEGYWEPDVTLDWSDNVSVKGYVGSFFRTDKGKIKNTPRISLLLQLGTYCIYPADTYATYIVNGKIKMDKKTELVKSIKCTLNGWGEYDTEFTDIGGPSQGQFEGKFTATLLPGGVPMPQGSMEYAPSAMVMPGTGAPTGPVPPVSINPMVAAGNWHTAGLKSHGVVVAAGYNNYHECDVTGWKDIVQVAADDACTMGLKSDGTVLAVGDDSFSKVSGVSTWTGITQVDAGQVHNVGLKSDGTVLAVGDDFFSEVSGVGAWTGITQVSAGGSHTVGLVSGGTVVAVGDDSHGQVSGVGTWADISQVSAGYEHTVGLVSKGTVVAVGLDDDGEVSGVSTWTKIIQVAAGGAHTVGLKKDGTVVAVGDDTYGQVSGVSTWTNIVQVAAGLEHTVGLKADGTVVTTGNCSDGRCDTTGWNLAAIPYVVGYYPTKASVKFYDWQCNKGIVVKYGTLHITDQNGQKITGYWEPDVAIEGWPALIPVQGYVGPFFRDATKGKVKNTPRLSLMLEVGDYCTYEEGGSYVTYIINGKIKWDKKKNMVKSIKCTINGWGEWGSAFEDSSPSMGQFEGKFTASPPGI